MKQKMLVNFEIIIIVEIIELFKKLVLKKTIKLFQIMNDLMNY